jgi:GNAT superfamily N-acetyltransferase
MPCLIRPADLPDVVHLRAMIHTLARHHGDRPAMSLAQLHRDLFGPQPMAQALVADANGTLQGYALLCTHWRAHTGERAVDLHHLFVAPEARGLGTGRALIRAATQRARSTGAIKLTIGTDPDNTAAQDFYRHLGLIQSPQPGPRFAQTL